MKSIKKPKIVVICGPTASGKSNLAVMLAKKFDGEVISADSRQVYRGLNIGTGKITKHEMSGVPHHLIDITNPKKRYTVANYLIEGRKAIGEIYGRGHLPIICGGTGFYISALLDDFTLPDVPPNEPLRKKLIAESPDVLIKMLLKLDPDRAKSVDPKNIRRVIRAIEIAKAIGKVPSQKNLGEKKYDVLQIGIATEKKLLLEKISSRLAARLKRGMIGEARQLHRKGLSWRRMEELGLEYKYMALFLQNKMPKIEMRTKLEAEIWQYARRQMTWFNHVKQIKWFGLSDWRKIAKEVKAFS